MRKYKKRLHMVLNGSRNAHESERSWYAIYRENGIMKRMPLRTRNERVAQKRFLELCDRLDKGILAFSLRPKLLPFVNAARTFLSEATEFVATRTATQTTRKGE